MIPLTRFRRIGWFAALSVCVACYTLLHVKVNAVHAEVVKAERQIIALERTNNLLESEVLTRASQVQLARWNRVEFGLSAPEAQQFIGNERQLAQFSSPREAGAPAPIRLAGAMVEGDAPAFPELAGEQPAAAAAASPAVAAAPAQDGGRLTVLLASDRVRVPLGPVVRSGR